MLRNTKETWGLIAITLHWLVAVVVLGMFGLGLWMVELIYYDDWYRSAPAIHKAVGVLLFLTMVLRLGWRWLNPQPAPLPTHSQLERRVAGLTHALLYGLLFVVMLSGYLISTADGRAIDVFGLDVKRYPDASFRSTAVDLDEDGTGTVTGDFSFHGVTKPVTLEVEEIGAGPDPWGGYRRGFQGATRFALKDFGMDYDLGPASQVVEIILSIEGVRQDG